MTASSVDDAATVLAGRRGRDGCWCQRFTAHDADDNETAFRAEVASASVPIGLVAYADSLPAGWTRVVPRASLPGVTGNRALRRVFERDPVAAETAWWVSCFVVRRQHRGHGVGVALLRAAVEHAQAQGAAVLDGHPVDVARLQAQPSPTAVFTGTLRMFEAVGFTEIGRTYPSRPVMRRSL